MWSIWEPLVNQPDIQKTILLSLGMRTCACQTTSFPPALAPARPILRLLVCLPIMQAARHDTPIRDRRSLCAPSFARRLAASLPLASAAHSIPRSDSSCASRPPFCFLCSCRAAAMVAISAILHIHAFWQRGSAIVQRDRARARKRRMTRQLRRPQEVRNGSPTDAQRPHPMPFASPKEVIAAGYRLIQESIG